MESLMSACANAGITPELFASNANPAKAAPKKKAPAKKHATTTKVKRAEATSPETPKKTDRKRPRAVKAAALAKALETPQPKLSNWEARPIRRTVFWRGSRVRITLRGGVPGEDEYGSFISYRMSSSGCSPIELKLRGDLSNIDPSASEMVVGTMTVFSTADPEGNYFRHFEVELTGGEPFWGATVMPSAYTKGRPGWTSRFFGPRKGMAITITMIAAPAEVEMKLAA